MKKQELHPRTALINKKQKIQSKKIRHEALLWLAATFPKAFDNTLAIHPLKLGIMADILQHADKAFALGISKAKLREAVVIFTRRLDYLASLKAKDMRIDLEGNPCTQVTDEEAARAALKIKKRVEKSVKNARPVISPSAHKSKNGHYSMYADEPELEYQERTPEPCKAPAIIIKATRQYDPEAVARLKEKLGLSRENIVRHTEDVS